MAIFKTINDKLCKNVFCQSNSANSWYWFPHIYHNSATVASQSRLEQLGENGVSVGDVNNLFPHGHISQSAGGEREHNETKTMNRTKEKQQAHLMTLPRVVRLRLMAVPSLSLSASEPDDL